MRQVCHLEESDERLWVVDGNWNKGVDPLRRSDEAMASAGWGVRTYNRRSLRRALGFAPEGVQRQSDWSSFQREEPVESENIYTAKVTFVH